MYLPISLGTIVIIVLALWFFGVVWPTAKNNRGAISFPRYLRGLGLHWTNARRIIMLLLVILLILLFSGGGFYGYRSGSYGGRGMGLAGILVILLVIFLVMGGGFGHGIYLRWSFRTLMAAAALNNKWRTMRWVEQLTIMGRLMDAGGVVTYNQLIKNEGRTDQAVGKVKTAVDRVIDKAKK
jgi:uncharacterized protein YjbJ (UPF0337 family)